MMNAQQLEYIRLELTRALHDDSGGTKGQLQAFIEHPPADKNHLPRQKIHKVALEGGARSTPKILRSMRWRHAAAGSQCRRSTIMSFRRARGAEQ